MGHRKTARKQKAARGQNEKEKAKAARGLKNYVILKSQTEKERIL